MNPMKKILVALSTALVLALGAYAQPEIEFEKEVHNFGKMKQHGDASTEFKFTNNGTEPLIISNAKGSCGCTVPEWPREPIQPGESSAIKVKYDSKRIGPINKSVTITSNAENSPTKVIRIKGNIQAAPKTDDSAMPVKEPTMAPAAERISPRILSNSAAITQAPEFPTRSVSGLLAELSGRSCIYEIFSPAQTGGLMTITRSGV